MRENETKNFWLQMVNDFYDSDRMMYLECRPHGQEYCLFYTKLLLKSVRTGGVLRLSEKLAYTDELIASFTRMPVEVVREAMRLLTELDLVEIWEDGTIFLPEVEDMVGSETIWAGKKRKVREKKQNEEDNVPEEKGQCEDIVPEKEGQFEDNVPINKRKENNNKTNNSKEEERKEPAPGARARSSSVKGDVKNKYGGYGWIELTEKEHTQLLNELGEAELARCIAYIDESAQSTGNRNRWKDWALILRRCSREKWGMKQEQYSNSAKNSTIGYHSYEEDECDDCSEKTGGVAELERMREYLAKLKARNDEADRLEALNAASE